MAILLKLSIFNLKLNYLSVDVALNMVFTIFSILTHGDVITRK